MIPSIRQLVNGNIPKPKLFVEPFCGGGSVSLGLLELDVVETVLLADLDELIAAFWKQVARHTERLIADMMDEPVTVERWDYWRGYHPRNDREKALKCLFLNRTTFSGIIHGAAGPIGGRKQASQYTIDCRFEKDALARRIRNAGKLAASDRIVRVHKGDWRSTVKVAEELAAKHDDPEATLFYLDPPYIRKASKLYELAFEEQDHRDLADFLGENRHRWILSYDREPLVEDLYRGMGDVREFRVTHHYTAAGKNRKSPVPGREVIFTNLPVDPVRD
jgi:DNA adenine methylase